MPPIPLPTLILLAYLALFLAGTVRAGRAAGQRVWLFGQARGKDRLSAAAFRLAFVLALAGPILPLPMPGLPLPVTGALIAAAGALLALAAQWGMGASWRVGVRERQAGALVSSGLFRLTRNPTFVGQAVLLAGVVLGLPSIPGLVAVPVFLWAAQTQIRREESVLLQSHGAAYAAYMARTPRWIGRPGPRGFFPAPAPKEETLAPAPRNLEH